MKNQDSRCLKSQKAIIEAGLKIFSVNPDAPMSEVAHLAGVGRATLYRQYQNREVLIQAIALYCLDLMDQSSQQIEKTATSAMDAVQILFTSMMPLAECFLFLKKTERIYEENLEIKTRNEKHQRDLLDLVQYGKKTGAFRKDLEDEWFVQTLHSLLYLGWQYQIDTETTADEVAEKLFKTFKSGFSKRAKIGLF